MKIITVIGTRPEIIRLSRVIEKLDSLCDHILVHTGQNFDPGLSDIFFKELGVRKPDHYLGIQSASFGEQIGNILAKSEEIFREEKPDKILILGDTNSGISALIAKRLGIPIYHMEAGNRCYDDRVPEEMNRRIIDHCSDILLPYTERSRSNLMQEGIPSKNIYVTGNPIFEVINHYKEAITHSTIHNILNIKKGKYFLATLHRAENVDNEERLREFLKAFTSLNKLYGIPVICSLHPRTRNKIKQFDIHFDASAIQFFEPFGFFDFIRLEQDAMCVISDSGTVQEECCLFQVPNVTIRDVTERPETIECGSNILTGADHDTILKCVQIVISQPQNWSIPQEYLVENVSTTVLKVILGL